MYICYTCNHTCTYVILVPIHVHMLYLWPYMYICYTCFNYSANIVYAQINKPKSSFNSFRPVPAPEESVYHLEASGIPERFYSADSLENGSKPSAADRLLSRRLQSSAIAPTGISKKNLPPTKHSSVDCTMLENTLYASSLV